MIEIYPQHQENCSFPIALVVSQFNREVTKALRDGALSRLKDYGFQQQDIVLVEVPGAVEIPYAVQLLARSHQVEVIVALGAVIRGETSHYDYVCEQVSQGCQKIMLDEGIPVIFGLLTTDDEQQALERVGGSHGHKGRDAIDTAVAMHSITLQCRPLYE
jgi:6,7-dimethyl-8-ribityllumazine synthase